MKKSRKASKKVRARTPASSRIVKAAERARAKRAKPDKIDDLSMPDVARKPVTLGVSCGSCVFHKRFAAYDHPCHDVGVAAASVPCVRYCPDPTLVAKGEELFALARAVGSAKNTSLLAAMFVTGHRARRHGFSVGQQVVFRVSTADFMSNYVRAIVVGATTKQVMLAGYDNFTALMHPISLLNMEQWSVKRRQLIKSKAINDPVGIRRVKVKGANALAMHEPELLRAPAPKKRGRPPKKLTGADLARRKIKSDNRTITLSN